MPQFNLSGVTLSTEREWLVQRIGWILWAVIILGAIGGIFGPGPLSSTIAKSSDGTTQVSFNKFLHYHSSETIEIILRPERGSKTADLFLSRSLLDNLEIRKTEPESNESILEDDGVVYIFSKLSSADSVKVVLHVEYQNYGTSTGAIGLAGHALAQLNQFVYP